ncbi:MAG: sulfatase [Planctomycetales bacterium]|nr:sulfatase [Planctomycetales bacterium]
MSRTLRGILFSIAIFGGSFIDAQDSRPNVLFIAVDDLRPQLACYGQSFMHSPNIDRLATQGVLFERAYCMVPTCGASRAALMTSVRPAPKRFVNHLAWAEQDAPDAVPLHTHFNRHGYKTISLGKVFHHKQDHADGWTEPAWRSSKPGYQLKQATAEAIELNKSTWPNKNKHNGPAYESADAEEKDYPDGDCAARAVGYLEQFAKASGEPFFLAVGFLKPHLPFNAPKKYWDLYDHEAIDLPDNYWPPKNAPEGAVHNSGELRAYAGIPPTGPVDRDTARNLIHGYYACVSFTDAQIGKLLNAVDRLGLKENTIIVLWGDHGWQLGEHGMWNKHSCFETSMHAPLIISAPHSEGILPGSRVGGLVEFIDIYPTLCELSGLELPVHLQGSSLVTQMRDPQSAGKAFAIGRFGSGDTIRSNNSRYSEYRTAKGELLGQMLYDHQVDADENNNVAGERQEIVQELAGELATRKGKN